MSSLFFRQTFPSALGKTLLLLALAIHAAALTLPSPGGLTFILRYCRWTPSAFSAIL
jgi:hypothetical protein